jgi:O-antigen ligase
MSIASYDYLNKHHHVFRFFALAAFLLGVTASLLSGSRGAWLAIPGLFVVLYFYTRKYLKRSHQALIVSVFIAAAFVLYQVPETKIAPRINSVFSEIHNYLQGNVQYGGATVRILGWRAGITIFSMHPITGSGTGNYKPLVDRLVAQDILHEMTAKHSQPASTFLETMVACGIPGLLALIGIFIAPFRLSMHFILDKDLKGIGYALMMLVVAFTIFGLTEAIFRRSMFTGFYVFMTAALIAIAGNIKSVKQSGRTRDGQPEQL